MKTVKAYAGIGSRSTPIEILDLMVQLGVKFHAMGFILRSGHAAGADSAFEREVPADAKEIYLPFGRVAPGQLLVPSDVYEQAEAIAASIHPAWNRCNEMTRKLHTRNVCQVLGRDLESPSAFVVYWAPESVNGVVSGGTATAVNVARLYGVPAYNLLFEHNLKKAESIIKAPVI